MVTRVNVLEAKSSLSKLLAAAERGDIVEICRSGRPVARLVPVAPPSGKRILGGLAGHIDIHDPNWDAPMNEDEFLGRSR
jgi:prevent-host-death family protein